MERSKPLGNSGKIRDHVLADAVAGVDEQLRCKFRELHRQLTLAQRQQQAAVILHDKRSLRGHRHRVIRNVAQVRKLIQHFSDLTVVERGTVQTQLPVPLHPPRP